MAEICCGRLFAPTEHEKAALVGGFFRPHGLISSLTKFNVCRAASPWATSLKREHMGRKIRADHGGQHNARIVPPVTPVPEPYKVAPDSLRYVLQCCRVVCAPKTPSFAAFAKRLKQAWPPERGIDLKIDRLKISEIERGKVAISYALLEAYGRVLNEFPSGLILLASRATVEKRDNGAEGLAVYFSGVRRALDELEKSMAEADLRPSDLGLAIASYHSVMSRPSQADEEHLDGVDGEDSAARNASINRSDLA